MWYTPVILACRRGRQKDPKFEDSLRYSSDILSQLKKDNQTKREQNFYIQLVSHFKIFEKRKLIGKIYKIPLRTKI